MHKPCTNRLRIAIRSTLLLLAVYSGNFGPTSGSVIDKIILQNLDLTSSFDGSVWENDGFEKANANTNTSRAFSNSSYYQNSTSMFLLARKSASLSTVLHNFNHTFLCLKFLSLIGKSMNQSECDEAARILNLTSTSTTMATTSTTISTTTTTTTETPKVQAPAPDVVKIVPQTPSGSSTVQESSSNLNQPSSSSHIIEITLNPDVGTQLVSNLNVKIPVSNPIPAGSSSSGSRRRRKRELDSKEISQVQEIFSQALSNTNKAQLNSNPNGTNDQPNIVNVQSNSNVESKASSTETIPSTTQGPSTLPATGNTVPTSTSATHSAPDAGQGQGQGQGQDPISYKRWKELGQDMTKRPPGFYVTVNGQIVYDNWEGVASHIMGKTIYNSSVTLWNETEIFIDMGPYVPHRDVKILFEWEPEPSDPSTLIFLNGITLGTLEGSNEVEKSLAPSIPATANVQPQQSVLHNNITLFIVVKSQATSVEDPKLLENSSGSSNLPTNINVTTTEVTIPSEKMPTIPDSDVKKSGSSSSSTPAPSPPVDTEKPLKILNRDPKINYTDSKKNADISALIVLGVLAILFIVIIVGLIHRKYLERQNRNSPNCFH